MASQSMTFDLIAKDRASRVFGKVGDAAERTESSFSRAGRTLAKVGKVAAVGLGAGAVAAGYALRGMVSEARESAKVGRITENAIRATGKAANVTAGQVADLSESLSNKVGIDDEVIQTGANLLLTFKNVANEAGRGNDVFNRATKAATDLSIQFGSVDSSAKMLGKALNDPVAGITALSRAGVTFSEQQKEQIKNFVETGDLLSAQKLILREVESQVGGAAKAAADPMQRLSVVLGNVQETIGTAFLPAIESAATWLADNLPDAVRSASGFIRGFADRVGGIAQTVVDAFQDVAPRVRAVFERFVPQAGPLVARIRERFAQIGQPLIAAIRDGLGRGDWSSLGQVIGDGIARAAGGANRIAQAVLTVVQGVDWLNLGKEAARIAIPFAIGLFNELIPAFLRFVKENPVDALVFVTSLIPFGRIAGLLSKVLGKLPIVGPILRAISGAGGAVEGAFRGLFSVVGRAAGFLAPTLTRQVRNALDTVVTTVYVRASDARNAMLGFGRDMVGGFLRPIGGLGDRAVGIVNAGLSRIFRLFRGAGGWLLSAGADMIRGFIAGIRSMAASAARAAVDVARNAWESAKNFLQIRSPSRLMVKVGGNFSEGLAEGIRKGSDKAVDAVREMVEKVAGRLDTLRERARGVASGVADSVRSVVDVSAIGAPVVVGQDAEGNDITRTPSVTETLGQFAAQAQQFAAALAEMARKKLAPSLIAAVAAAGPVSGLTAAQALASAAPDQVASVNASIGAIDQLARQAGQTVLKTTPLPEQVKREERQLEKLQQILEATRAEKVAKVTVEGDKLVVLIEREQQRNRRRG